MRVVFLNQYYPPDAAPTGVMLQAVAERMAAEGHEVTVICAAGGYSGGAGEREVAAEIHSRVKVRRIGATRFGRGTFVGKLLDYFSYYLGCAWGVLRMEPSPDRVVALTTPPYLSVLARLVSKLRGGDHAHWVMDLYPDVMAAHGMLSERGVPYRILSGLARWGFGGKRAAAVLGLGPDMAERIDRLRGEADGKAGWVALWSSAEPEEDGGRVAELRRQRGWQESETIVMYSGNMGLGHRFGEILEVAGRPQEDEAGPSSRPRFVFYGRGKRRPEIERFVAKHPDRRVEVRDYAPASRLASHLRSADVHLVSLDAAWTGTMVPSKLQGIFSIGRPVIFIGGGESSIGRWVAESGGGWQVGPGDVAGLSQALDQACDPEERKRRGEAAARFAADHFDRTTNVAAVAGIFGKPC